MEVINISTDVLIVGGGLAGTNAAMGVKNKRDRYFMLRVGSVGLPVFDTECKVVDLETGEDLPPTRKERYVSKGPR